MSGLRSLPPKIVIYLPFASVLHQNLITISMQILTSSAVIWGSLACLVHMGSPIQFRESQPPPLVVFVAKQNIWRNNLMELIRARPVNLTHSERHKKKGIFCLAFNSVLPIIGTLRTTKANRPRKITTKTLVSKEDIGARRRSQSVLFAPAGNQNPCSCSKWISEGDLYCRESTCRTQCARWGWDIAAFIRNYSSVLHCCMWAHVLLYCKLSLASVDHKVDYNAAKSILN
jgi:hypothetical protein